MPPDAPPSLRDMLSREARAASEAARRNGGKVPAEQLDELERLARLVELDQRAAPRLPRRRWPVAAALLGTLALVSVLLFARVGQTRIVLDLVLSGVAFDVAGDQVITESIAASAVGISGLDAIRLPRSIAQNRPAGPRPAGSRDAIRLQALTEEASEGTVTLAPLALRSGTAVLVETTGVDSHYRLLLSGPELELGVGVAGPVSVAAAGAARERVDVATPRSIRMEARDADVALAIALAQPPPITLSRQIAIQRLSLARIDEFQDLERTVTRRVSTIRSGAIYFESLQGQARDLRAGEMLSLAQTEGQIGLLVLDADAVRLRFHGAVRGLRTGHGDAARSLMPTYLEWLQARHGLSLLWGSTLYLFGLAIAAMKWWRGER